MVANAVFNSENTGVIPLPALKATTSPVPGPELEEAGRSGHLEDVPGRQVVVHPVGHHTPGVRFTVTCSSASTAGDEDIE